MRKICVYTGGRAEYGLLYWLLKEIQKDKELELKLIVSGSHLDESQGYTINTIEKDGFKIDYKIDILSENKSAVGLTKSMASSLEQLSDVLFTLKPDIGVVLGDRYEILTFAQTCMMLNIPLAHIHGGEATEGVIDDAVRHSVSKMSHIHFPSTELYKNRLIKMGENPKNVFNFGAPGIDNIKKLTLKNKSELFKELNLPIKDNNFLVTYHPVTLYPEKSKEEYTAMFKALLHFKQEFPSTNIIITMPNIEQGTKEITNYINNFLKNNSNVFVFKTLGQTNYLSMVKACTAVIGNSSSGIVEVPFFKKPTINIGERQRGRIGCKSIINCSNNELEILSAIKQTTNKVWLDSLKNETCIYGNGDTSLKIKEMLKKISLKDILYKPFFDC